MNAKNTALAEKAKTDLAVDSAYEDFAGGGFENQTSEDYAVPFLQILQGISPQVVDNEDMNPGMILNTVTGEIFKGGEGIIFIPSTTQRQYIEWVPRDQGGGFVAAFSPSDPMVLKCVAEQEFGQFSTPEGNDLIETFSVYGIAVDDEGNAQEAVIAFSSSKIKKYKGWMTKAKTIQLQLPDGRRIPAPLFAHRYRLTTVSEKNKKGQFYNWAIAFDGETAISARLAPDDDLFQAAVGIKQLIDSGKAHADYESQSPDAGVADGEGDGKPKF